MAVVDGPHWNPTREEIERARAEIDAEHIARGELPGNGGYNNQRTKWEPRTPGIRVCRYHGPGRVRG